jgi:hypothetical protein
MTDHISITDFASQIAQCNAARAASGLPLLDPDRAIKAAVHEWNRLLADARDRLQEAAGHDLADNAFTYQIISREAAPLFRAYLANLTMAPPPERDSERS